MKYKQLNGIWYKIIDLEGDITCYSIFKGEEKLFSFLSSYKDWRDVINEMINWFSNQQSLIHNIELISSSICNCDKIWITFSSGRYEGIFFDEINKELFEQLVMCHEV